MKYGDELIRLALGHSTLIEEAQAVLEETNEILIQALYTYTDTRLSDSFTLGEINEDLCFNFWRSEWKDKRDEPVAFFWFDHNENEGEGSDRSWMSILSGQTPAIGRFSFWSEYGEFGIKKRAWKKYLQRCFTTTPAFAEAGFTLSADGEAIIKPIVLDAACLAENYPNLDACFDNVAAALGCIDKLLPEFEKIVQRVQNWP